MTTHELKVPVGTAATIAGAASTRPTRCSVTFTFHTVKKGETLATHRAQVQASRVTTCGDANDLTPTARVSVRPDADDSAAPSTDGAADRRRRRGPPTATAPASAAPRGPSPTASKSGRHAVQHRAAVLTTVDAAQAAEQPVAATASSVGDQLTRSPLASHFLRSVDPRGRCRICNALWHRSARACRHHRVWPGPCSLQCACSRESRRRRVVGIDAIPVLVEVDVSRGGLPGLTMVGLPDATVRESRERVRTAIRNSGFPFPGRRASRSAWRRPICARSARRSTCRSRSAFSRPRACCRTASDRR